MFLVRLLIGALVSISVAFGNPDAALNLEEVYVSGDTIPQASVAQVVVSPITKTGFGAAITGVDVENLSDAEFDIINRTLLEYRVLVIRNQHDLSIDGQRNFTRRFGELQVHLESASHLPGYADVNVVSNIKNEDGAFTGLYGKHVENFHADLSWAQLPTKITVVRSVIRPEGCGHTEFLDTQSSFTALPGDKQADLLKKKATYCYLKTRDIKNGDSVEGLTEEQVKSAAKCAIHPLITTHPETGKHNIYANPSHTTAVLDTDQDQSDSILNYLFDFSASRQFLYQHRYTDGDLVVWDNRAVHHRGTGCPDDKPRKLVRTTAACAESPV